MEFYPSLVTPFGGEFICFLSPTLAPLCGSPLDEPLAGDIFRVDFILVYLQCVIFEPLYY